jgi:hypothetical protein
VDTLIRESRAASPPDPPRRHVIRWVAVTMTLLIVGAAAAGQGYLLRYQPLSSNGTGSFHVDDRYATSLGDFSSPSGETFTAYDVRYSDGAAFSYSFTIGNLGRLPVTIDSVTTVPCEDCVFPLEYVATRVAPAAGPDRFDPSMAEPFVPFRLDPGGYRLVEIATRFDHCEHWGAGDSTRSATIEVRYRAGWVHHTVRLALPYTLRVAFTASSCPD